MITSNPKEKIKEPRPPRPFTAGSRTLECRIYPVITAPNSTLS